MRNVVFRILLALLSIDYCVLAQSFNEVLITEIMSDPSPAVALPEAEYLELYNRTEKTISLKGWKLTMGTRSAIFPDSLIMPHSNILLCEKGKVPAFSKFGAVIGFTTFGLPNEGATLSLYNSKNQLVYSVSYTDTWWPPAWRNGGYALEMLDVDNPCGERANWMVSSDTRGGSPNQVNSVTRRNVDESPPLLERIEVPGNSELVMHFNKRLDSLSASKGAEIKISGRVIRQRMVSMPDCRRLAIHLDSPLLKGQHYELDIQNLADCSGNLLRSHSVPFGLPVEADSGDVVINEILFNPRAGGVDFVEIYNRSTRYVSLANWGLKNTLNGSGDLAKIITKDKLFLPPNGFLALSVDADIIKGSYPADKSRSLLSVPSMPGFSNDEGEVVLQNSVGAVMDRVRYAEKMHHPLISDTKGVSLERVDSGRQSWEPTNWHSAAGTVGYATPGYANSQSIELAEQDEFYVEPEAFSPGLNGADAVAEIKYRQQAAGRMATIQVFNLNGFLVKNIIRNQLVGTAGKITWDGTNHEGTVVKTGYYLILIDTFDLNGNKKQFKKKVVVASH